MFAVKSNHKKNRLYVGLGSLRVSEADKAIEAILEAAATLDKGFSVILDLTKYRPSSEIVTRKICQVQDFLHEQGMGKLIRATQSVLAMLEFDKVGVQKGMAVQTTSSVLEAEKILDWWLAEQAQPQKDLMKRLEQYARKGDVAIRLSHPI